MLLLRISPGIGAGPIELGVEKGIIRRRLEKLGYPLTAEHGELDYFCNNALQLEYKNGVVRFIGISEHPEIECTFDDIDVFDCEATALFRILSANESVPPSVSPGETCFFPSQGLNLWESDEQYDRKGGYRRKVYAQIGIEKPTCA